MSRPTAEVETWLAFRINRRNLNIFGWCQDCGADVTAGEKHDPECEDSAPDVADAAPEPSMLHEKLALEHPRAR